MRAEILVPMNHANVGEVSLKLSETNAQLIYHVGAYDVCSVQMISQGASGVLTCYRSNDGNTPVALEDAASIKETAGPGNDMTDTIDCTGFMYLHVRVSTVEAGAVARIVAIGRAIE